jgi:hypothetical protein
MSRQAPAGFKLVVPLRPNAIVGRTVTFGVWWESNASPTPDEAMQFSPSEVPSVGVVSSHGDPITRARFEAQASSSCQ